MSEQIQTANHGTQDVQLTFTRFMQEVINKLF